MAFITGHEDPDKEETVLEWPRFAAAEGTLVFLMGVKNLAMIVSRLVEEGKSVDTPVALIRWGTYPSQRTVVGTLRDIVERAKSADIRPPTVVVVGEVVRLREQLNWVRDATLVREARARDARQNPGVGIVESDPGSRRRTG